MIVARGADLDAAPLTSSPGIAPIRLRTVPCSNPSDRERQMRARSLQSSELALPARATRRGGTGARLRAARPRIAAGAGTGFACGTDPMLRLRCEGVAFGLIFLVRGPFFS